MKLLQSFLLTLVEDSEKLGETICSFTGEDITTQDKWHRLQRFIDHSKCQRIHNEKRCSIEALKGLCEVNIGATVADKAAYKVEDCFWVKTMEESV